MGLMDRVATAGKVLVTGKVPNPLADEPKNRSRAALVSDLNTWCLETRAFWDPIFKRITEEQEFAAGQQWAEDYKCKGEDGEPFVADRIQQMLNRNTASTYAKNPTPEAKQVERMVFTVWDGTQESYNGAKAILDAAQPILQQAAAAQVMGQEIEPPPQELIFAKQIVEDYERGMAKKAMNAKIAKTYTLLIEEQWRTQSPEFLASMKQLVTQIYAARVGFVKIMYRRGSSSATGDHPMLPEQANLPVDQIAALKQRLDDMLQPGFDQNSAEAEETRLLMQNLASKGQSPDGAGEQDVDDEGVVYDFLGPRNVLIDPACKCMREFVGARRIAHEIVKPVEDVEAEFDVSLRDCGAVPYVDGQRVENADHDGDKKKTQTRGNVCVWHIEDKSTGLCYVVCDGVKNLLCEPYEPKPALTRFWSIVPITFNVQSVTKNDPKKDVTIYPRSHVRLAMPMQRNINQAGEELRAHRIAARPYKVGVKSKFDDEDLKKLSGPRSSHDCIMLNNLNEGEKADDYFQNGPVPDFHPELFATGPDDQALMLATGAQPANLGAQNPDETATGQAIAEGSRISVDDSNSGEVDYGLSTIAQATFEMLLHMPPDKVKRRVGEGAVVPELTQMDVRNEIFFQIVAGSSGRPNQATEVKNFQILGPMLQDMLVQAGKSTEPLIKEAVRRLNDKADVDDYLKPAQVPAGPQQIAPVGPINGQPAPGLPPGTVAPNVKAPGQPPGAPPIPPVSRNQIVATAGGV